MSNILGKIKVMTTMLIVCAFLGSALSASGMDHRDRKCEQRIRRAQDNLRRAERRHGEHSRQAQQKRRELEDARAHCRY
jgi:hypothetical protein